MATLPELRWVAHPAQKKSWEVATNVKGGFKLYRRSNLRDGSVYYTCYKNKRRAKRRTRLWVASTMFEVACRIATLEVN